MLSREEAKKRLKQYWNPDLRFLAVFLSVKNPKEGAKPHGYFHLKSNDRDLIYPPTPGYVLPRSVTIFRFSTPSLQDGAVYELEVDLAEDEHRLKQNNPFQLKISSIKTLEQSLEVMDAKDFIADWFGRKGASPGDAASIAAQLRLNQLELYTQTKRFIFELIQNADDMPMHGKEVLIDIRLLENFFLFSHNGQYFSRNDVMAISDAAKSTKRGDETKTGYKGIGFKSVFSDSAKVFIRSQDYSFKFDSSAPVFTDYRELYRPHWSKFSRLEQQRFFAEYDAKSAELTDINNIPWQIKPIWVEPQDYPAEITPYFSRVANVNIGLEVGASRIKEKKYDGMITGLMADPRFLLFLRHVRKVQYQSPRGENRYIEVVKEDGLTSIYSQGTLQSAYRAFEVEVAIGNEAFARAGFGFQRSSLDNKFSFKDSSGNELHDIPEKLGRLQKTVLSFAVMEKGGAIEKIPASESVLYNYLPTSDGRYGFPFIINADFIAKTDREGILSENLWNHYLFFSIGYALVDWLSRLSGIESLSYSHLNVLPPELLDATHPELGTINASFNRGLLLALREGRFIPDIWGVQRPCSSLLIDDTGLSDVIGSSALCAFTGSRKFLVSRAPDRRRLKTAYLEIEVLDFSGLKALFGDQASLGRLNTSLQDMQPEKLQAFVDWLEKACEKNLGFADIREISFLSFRGPTGNFASISGLDKQPDAFFYDALSGPAGAALLGAGARLSTINLDNYPNISALLKAPGNSYLASGKTLYLKWISFWNAPVRLLDPEARMRVLETLRRIEGIDTGTIAKLDWFRNNLGQFKALAELTDDEDLVYPSAYNTYFIHRQDKKYLGADYRKLLGEFHSLLKMPAFQLDFSAGQVYPSGDATLGMLSKFLSKALIDANLYPLLAERIQLDGLKINGALYQDQVAVSTGWNDTQQDGVSFPLKDLLPRICEGSKNISRLMAALISLTKAENDQLTTKVFALQQMGAETIKKNMLSQQEALTDTQFIYLAIDGWFRKTGSQARMDIDVKNPLSLGYQGGDPAPLGKLLDFMFLNEVPAKEYVLQHKGLLYHLIPKNAVCGEAGLLFPDEQLPVYLSSWMGTDVDKKAFLAAMGLPVDRYGHLGFRKAISERNMSAMEEALELLEENPVHFGNTAVFLGRQEMESGGLDWCRDILVAFYNKLVDMKPANILQLGFPVYNHQAGGKLMLSLLDTSKKYYSNLPEWGLYRTEVAAHLHSMGYFLVPGKLTLPAPLAAQRVELTEQIDADVLSAHSRRFDAPYYEKWSGYTDQVINLYEGEFLPFQVCFGSAAIAVSLTSRIQSARVGEAFFVSNSLAHQIPFCLKEMDPATAMSLARAKFAPERNGNSGGEQEFTEEETRELQALFGRELSPEELAGHWLIACFRALKHYESEGYDTDYCKSRFEDCLRKRMLERLVLGHREIGVMPRSAKENLLRISLAAWNNLELDNAELFVLDSHSHRIFTSQEQLIQGADNLLFSISSEEEGAKARIVSSLFSQESISDAQFDPSINVVLLVQLSGGSRYSSLFNNYENRTALNEF